VREEAEGWIWRWGVLKQQGGWGVNIPVDLYLCVHLHGHLASSGVHLERGAVEKPPNL